MVSFSSSISGAIASPSPGLASSPPAPVRRTPKGLDHYSRLVDTLLAANIRPFCTKYHWDLPQALEDKGGWPNRDPAGYYADYAAIVGKHLGDRITVWAPFHMPCMFAYLGYGAGAFPPGKADYTLFLRAAHTISLAQSQALRALKAASSQAAVGSAYGMALAYPKTPSEADRAATAPYHAMTMFSSSTQPCAASTPKPSSVNSFQGNGLSVRRNHSEAPLDWVGFHHYTRRIVSDATPGASAGSAQFGTETELDGASASGRDRYTRFRAEMPTEVHSPMPDSKCTLLASTTS